MHTYRRPKTKEGKTKCPSCGHLLSHVISDWDHRPFYDASRGAYVRFRRCDACRKVFWTEEVVVGLE